MSIIWTCQKELANNVEGSATRIFVYFSRASEKFHTMKCHRSGMFLENCFLHRRKGTLEFFLNVSLNSANSVTKIFVITVKGLKLTISCVRDQPCYHSPSKTHVRDKIFKLATIHVSVICQIPWIRWIHWEFCPFRKNSIAFLFIKIAYLRRQLAYLASSSSYITYFW